MNKIFIATTFVLFAITMGLGTIAIPAMATGPADRPAPPTNTSADESCDALANALALATESGDRAAVNTIKAVMAQAGCN